jgi:hypothetical protein
MGGERMSFGFTPISRPLPSGPPPTETLVWTFGASVRYSQSALKEEDTGLGEPPYGLAIESRSNTWSGPGGPITTDCGFVPPYWGIWFGTVTTPELEGYVYSDSGFLDVEIHIPQAQAGSGWRLYAGWGDGVTPTSATFAWKNGVGASGNGFATIGTFSNMNSYAHIDGTQYDGATSQDAADAWEAAYDNHYVSATLTDQGAGNTGVTLRIVGTGLRIRHCHWRARRYT